MPGRKPCVRCARQIDAYARICPFCNWDQSEPAPSPEGVPPAVPYSPPRHHWRKGALVATGFVALVIIAFVVGSLGRGLDEKEAKAAQERTTSAAPSAVNTNPTPPKNVTLVPVTGSDTAAPLDEPITSVPASTPAQQPNDTTALPSQQYAAAAAQAKAEEQKEAQQANAITDPRALKGQPYQQTPPKPVPEASSASEPSAGQPLAQPQSARTAAVPIYKPLPHLFFDEDVAAHLTVTVTPEGHVSDVQVDEPMPDIEAVVAAVYRWQFRPATVDGNPVEARVAVDILFHGNG